MSAATFLAMNPWAILVGVLASFFVSFVWYGLVFQKAWLAALGISAADLEDMRLGKTTPFVVAGLTYAVLGVVTVRRGPRCANGHGRSDAWPLDLRGVQHERVRAPHLL